MGFNLAGMSAALKGQQEYDQYMQAKKIRDMQIQQFQEQNDPQAMAMAWNTMQQNVPPMPGQASQPAQPPMQPPGPPNAPPQGGQPMPPGGPQMPPGGMQAGGPMPQPPVPQAPPIPPYKSLGPPQDNAGPDQGGPQPKQPVPQASQPAAQPQPSPQPGAPVALKQNMSLQDAQRFIQQNYGNATAQQKFSALEKVHAFMSADAKIELQTKMMEQKTAYENAQIEIKKQLATTDEKYKSSKDELMKAQAELTSAKKQIAELDLKLNPRKVAALEKTADAKVTGANASAARAATAATAAGSGAKLDADDLKAMAKQAVAGDKSVFQNLGRGKQGAENIVGLRKAMRKEMEAQGKTPEEIAIANAEFEGLKAGERTLGTRTATVGMAGNAAANLGTQVLETSKAYKRMPWKSLNAIQETVDDKTQSAELRAFAGAVNSYINAYARAINPQGAATVSDKEHAREILDKGFSNGDVKAAIAQLQKEIDAEKKAPGQTKEELRDLAAGGKKELQGKSDKKDGNVPVFSNAEALSAAIKAGKIKKGDKFNDPSGTEHTVN